MIRSAENTLILVIISLKLTFDILIIPVELSQRAVIINIQAHMFIVAD
jgi:hypothetical protein